MAIRKRRKRRSRLNPLRWVTPAIAENITKVTAIIAASSVPALMVSHKSTEKIEAAEVRADSAQTQVEYANANTNAALAIGALLSARLDSALARIDRLERREGRRARRDPEAAYGPDVPRDWMPQPPRKSFWDRLRGR